MNNDLKKLIWLDDIRSPFTNPEWLIFSPIDRPYEVIWVKNYNEFVNWITDNGLPDGICFDHDLSLVQIECGIALNILPEDEKTGYDCANWLVNYCIDHDHLPIPKFSCQSANPPGKERILALLNNYSVFFVKKNMIYL